MQTKPKGWLRASLWVESGTEKTKPRGWLIASPWVGWNKKASHWIRKIKQT